MNLKVISKYNIPRKKPTWNDFTWSSIFFTLVTLDSKLTSPQKPFWSPGRADNLEIMTWIQDLPHPLLICAICQVDMNNKYHGICIKIDKHLIS